MRKTTATATPIPIPAFAPVLSPLSFDSTGTDVADDVDDVVLPFAVAEVLIAALVSLLLVLLVLVSYGVRVCVLAKTAPLDNVASCAGAGAS